MRMCTVNTPVLQVWPEVTDPEKFVFEDVAIATYLLVSLISFLIFPLCCVGKKVRLIQVRFHSTT